MRDRILFSLQSLIRNLPGSEPYDMQKQRLQRGYSPFIFGLKSAICGGLGLMIPVTGSVVRPWVLYAHKIQTDGQGVEENKGMRKSPQRHYPSKDLPFSFPNPEFLKHTSHCRVTLLWEYCSVRL